jgi:ankyrin repeat protein
MKRDIYAIAKFGDLEEFKKAFASQYLNQKSNHGAYLLHYAIAGSNFDIALFLLGNGADPKVLNAHFQSPLHLSCINENIEVARRLISRGADLSCKDKFAGTPLGTATFNCSGKNYDVVELRASVGSNPFDKSKYGISSMDFAEKVGDRKLISILSNSKGGFTI